MQRLSLQAKHPHGQRLNNSKTTRLTAVAAMFAAADFDDDNDTKGDKGT